MTHLGILVSPCQVRIEIPECRVMVVEDRELGTNDCRGWITCSVFNRLRLPDHRFYQFRLAFEKTQAKGSFKVMENDCAERLEAGKQELETACRLAPDYTSAPYLLGILESRTGNMARSAGLLQKVVSAEPRITDAQYTLGRDLFQLGKTDEATAHWRQAVEADPAAPMLSWPVVCAALILALRAPASLARELTPTAPPPQPVVLPVPDLRALLNGL